MKHVRDDRPMRYIETAPDGTETVVYRASHLGGCEKELLAVAAGMTGAAMPAWFQKVLDEGSLSEGVIASMREEETGVPTLDDQLEVELEIGEINGRRVIIRGHIDGHCRIALREYKKFRESTWPDFLRQGIEVQRNYPWQLSVYMHALDLPAEVTGGRLVGYYDMKEEGDPKRTIYAKLEDVPAGVTPLPEIGEIHTHHVEYPPVPMKDIRRRIVRWERLIEEGTPIADGKCEKPYAYPCPFYDLHPDEDDPEVYAISPRNKAAKEAVTTIHTTSTEIAELAARIRVLDKERKAAATVLKAELVDMGEEADTAKLIGCGDLTLIRTRTHREATTVKAYDIDSFSAAKDTDKPKPRKTAAKKAAGTTRVGGRK